MVDVSNLTNGGTSTAPPLIKEPPVSIRNNARKARAHGYRLRAEELRVISTEVVLPETKRTLLGLAECYEQMATGLDNSHYA